MAAQKNTRNTVVSIEDAIKEVNIEGGRGDRVKALEATRKVNIAVSLVNKNVQELLSLSKTSRADFCHFENRIYVLKIVWLCNDYQSRLTMESIDNEYWWCGQ